MTHIILYFLTKTYYHEKWQHVFKSDGNSPISLSEKINIIQFYVLQILSSPSTWRKYSFFILLNVKQYVFILVNKGFSETIKLIRPTKPLASYSSIYRRFAS